MNAIQKHSLRVVFLQEQIQRDGKRMNEISIELSRLVEETKAIVKRNEDAGNELTRIHAEVVSA